MTPTSPPRAVRAELSSQTERTSNSLAKRIASRNSRWSKPKDPERTSSFCGRRHTRSRADWWAERLESTGDTNTPNPKRVLLYRLAILFLATPPKNEQGARQQRHGAARRARGDLWYGATADPHHKGRCPDDQQYHPQSL